MKAIGLFLGALLAISVVGCGDGGSGSSGGGGAGGTTASGGSTATGGSTSSGGSTSTGGSTGGSSGVSCDAYCAEIATNCTGDQQMYADNAGCMGICAKLDPGTAADMDGDTVGCREYHGGAPAAGDAATHCKHAGPLGGGVCGANECDVFCNLAVAVCGTTAYADMATCTAACANFPDTTAVPYSANVNSGDSLACRMYHLSVASSSDANATTHCPHVGVDSAPCK